MFSKILIPIDGSDLSLAILWTLRQWAGWIFTNLTRKCSLVWLLLMRLCAGGAVHTVMNAANEIAVESFLSGDLRFTGIAEVVSAVMDDPPEFDDQTLSGILRGDQLARADAHLIIKSLGEK